MSVNPKQAAGNDELYMPGWPDRRGGGNNGGDMLESRVARLESDVSHIKSDIADIKADIRDMRKDMSTDFRLLFGCLIVTALGLAGLMAKGFHWL